MKKSPSKSIVFLSEFRSQLTEIPAKLIGESKPRCSVCHEPLEGHSRGGRRKHIFIPETGSTIEVRYPDQKTPVIYHNVMQGTTANCWKEK